MIPAINSLSASFALVGLPIGVERATWVPHALAREDVKIKPEEEEWPDRAMQSARNLKERYAWSLEARAELRKQARLDQAKRSERLGGD
jgi:hypothetical protein